MTNYVKSTNFASKDSLATGNPLKIVKGTEIDTEFNNIATAISTKSDSTSPTFSTGVTLDYMTANQVAYIGASKELTGSSLLTFDGSTFTATSNMLLKKTANTANTYSLTEYKTGYTPTGTTNTNTDGSIKIYGKDQNGVEAVVASIEGKHTTASSGKFLSLGNLSLTAYYNNSGSSTKTSYLNLEAGGTTLLYGAQGLNYDVASGQSHVWDVANSEAMRLDDAGVLSIQDLAGTGTRPVYANSSGELTTATAQTWQDVTSSRSLGTTYTNSTGQPIMVNVYATNTGASQYITLTIGGVIVAKQQGDTTNGAAASSICAIVPNGATYKVDGTRTLNIWAELR